MRTLLCLILMGVLSSQNLPIGRSQQPQIKTPFEIDYLDLPIPNTFNQLYRGQVLVSFQIDENGDVVNPEIIDTFDIKLNEAIIDKVMAISFEPALQNGRPVKVRYQLPILFK